MRDVLAVIGGAVVILVILIITFIAVEDHKLNKLRKTPMRCLYEASSM